MESLDKIKALIEDSIKTKQQLLEDNKVVTATENAAQAFVKCLQADGKILFCGNGGSAADAQHLAAELSGRFYHDRDPLFAEALHVNTSYITAVANDYSYDQVYSRLIKAKGCKGDVLVGISTSGNSGNVVKALEQAKEQGMVTIGMTGKGGGKMAALCDILIEAPSNDTPRIQECHILLGHIVCQLTEERLF